MYIILDNDCIYCILSYLEAFDIIKCLLINKQFNAVSKNEFLWKKLFEMDFSHIILISNNYYENYIAQIKTDYSIIENKNINAEIICSPNYIITYLSPQIGKMVNLKILQLTYNKLKFLPSEIGQLISLEFLHLSGNKLKIIPPEIGNLKNLSILIINNNPIRNLPVELSNLKNLRGITVDSILKEGIPIEVQNMEYLNIRYC